MDLQLVLALIKICLTLKNFVKISVKKTFFVKLTRFRLTLILTRKMIQCFTVYVQ
jgi:hypothetical protein